MRIDGDPVLSKNLLTAYYPSPGATKTAPSHTLPGLFDELPLPLGAGDSVSTGVDDQTGFSCQQK